jgi:hypothetical protein
MVSATKVHNWMINDPLVDWLNSTPRRPRSFSESSSSGAFTGFLQEKGHKFEDSVIDHLRTKVGKIITVATSITPESCALARHYMKQGAPLLHSVPVINNYNKTQGIIDLLVRSDHLNQIVTSNPLSTEEEYKSAWKLPGKYHYIVIDIKFSTLPLRADGIHLTNADRYSAYKAQTLIYTQAIGRIQGYTAPYAFILGRRWKCSSKSQTTSSLSCLSKLGKIDFKGVDHTVLHKTKKAIKWIRDVNQHGHNWGSDPPTRPELYPNMCIDSGKWNKEKRQLAETLGEITSIWNVGVRQRKKAHAAGVFSWKDPKCTSTLLQFKGNRAKTIDAILNINRQTTEKVLPKQLTTNLDFWKFQDTELFVDFETITDIFSDFTEMPYQRNTDMIFMIGVGWNHPTQGWKYQSFTCQDATTQEEFRIMSNFVKLVKDMNHPKLIFWSAEQKFWKRAELRQFDAANDRCDRAAKEEITTKWNDLDWYDMHKAILAEPIVVKDCFKFGLKDIAKAMHSHGLISTHLESSCQSGLTAMVQAWKYYKTPTDNRPTDIINDITKYNEFDTKVLWEILSYLRKKHV